MKLRTITVRVALVAVPLGLLTWGAYLVYPPVSPAVLGGLLWLEVKTWKRPPGGAVGPLSGPVSTGQHIGRHINQ